MAESTEKNTIPAGSRIGQYRIIRQIGSGGSGEVYLCRHIVLEKFCAIKILSIPSGEKGLEMQGRVLREARIARSIRHRNLVSVLDANVNRTDNTAWIVMEYVDGETLEELLSSAPLPESAAIYVCRCVAQVLAEAEKHNIVHRDIKPANILIDRDGNVKLTDLGIAKIDKADVKYDEPVTHGEKLLGTPDYASPEQLRDSSSVDTRADIYSLGATFYHMLSGRKPFEADGVFNLMAKVLETEPPDISGISPLTDALLKKMMAKDPEKRPANAGILLSELRKVSRANARQTSEIRKFLASSARRIFSDENVRFFTILRNTFIITCAIASGVMIFLHSMHEYGPGSGDDGVRKIISMLENKQSDKLRRLCESGEAKNIIKAVAGSGKISLLRLTADTVPELITSPEYASAWLDNLSDKKSRNMLRQLLQYKFPLNAAKAPDHSPAIFRKELTHDDELLQLLLEHKLDADVSDADGRTALLRMARNPKASVKCARLMLLAGVPINTRDRKQQNALLVASHAGNPKLVRFLYNSKIRLTDEDISRIPDTYNIKHELLDKRRAAAVKTAENIQLPQPVKKEVAPEIRVVPQNTAVAAVPAKTVSERRAASSYLAKVRSDRQQTAVLKAKRSRAAASFDELEGREMRYKIEEYLRTSPSGRLMVEWEIRFIESVISGLQSGRIDPDIRTGKESVHLLESVARGDIYPRKRLYRALLDAGADPDAVPMPENPELSRMLVLYGKTKFSNNELIKLLSVQSPDWEIAEKMVLRGVDPGVKSRKRKENAFHRAAALGNTAFLNFLIDSGREGADAVDAEGYTPYQKAVICGEKEAAKILENCGFKTAVTPAMRNTGNLFNAVRRNNPGDTAYHLRLGVIQGQVNGMYLNVLQYAVVNNCNEAAKVLLENGVSPDRYTGISPLESALMNRNEKMFALLVRHGADLQTAVKDRFGRNSLLFTAVFRYMNDEPDKLYDCFKVMLEKNWKWKNTTPDGDNPLTWMEKWNEGNPRVEALFTESR